MIDVDNVTVLSPRKKALLNDVSLSIKAGELVMILGPNGAGKSTLLKVLAGQHRPHHGSVTLHGRDLSEWPLAELAKQRAVMTQSLNIPFALRVAEVVEMGLTPWALGLRQKAFIVDEQLRTVGMSSDVERSYQTLSGGEQQRVQLARTLAQLHGGECVKPQLLLLDEPISALDLNHQQRTLRLMRHCAEQGMAVACVLHDVNQACLYADRIIMIESGWVRFDGTPEALRQTTTLESIYKADLISSAHPETQLPQWQFRR
jgi:iron complex transport system ATP-binding protein